MQYSHESFRPATYRCSKSFLEHLFWRTSVNGCFWFFKTATEHGWAASGLTLLLSSDNLLTGYEQLCF